MFSSDDILKQISPKEVDNQIYEIKITCEKVAKPVFSFRKKTNQAGTRAYKIKRPLQGTMKISMFCMFCERKYKLRVISDRNQTRKKYWAFLWFSFFMMGMDFYFDLERLWVMVPFPLYYIYLKLKTSFVDTTKQHKTSVIREFERIGVNFES